jgi:hypothetical protein
MVTIRFHCTKVSHFHPNGNVMHIALGILLWGLIVHTMKCFLKHFATCIWKAIDDIFLLLS